MAATDRALPARVPPMPLTSTPSLWKNSSSLAPTSAVMP